jgi:hypothetical protein
MLSELADPNINGPVGGVNLILNSKGQLVDRSSDPLFREAYLGGIVDVYKPHLAGQGFYYDVNSLYSRAMC